MSKLSNIDETKQFLMALQNDLIEDRKKELCQADPIYYSIMGSTSYPTSEDFAESVYLIIDDAQYEINETNLNEYLSTMDEDELDTLLDETDDAVEKIDDETFVIHDMDCLIHYLEDNDFATIAYTGEMQTIVPDTLFLTRKAAKDHMTRFGYNYPKNAHTYAMTAVRSPQYEKLLQTIKSIDWDKTKLVMKGDTDNV